MSKREFYQEQIERISHDKRMAYLCHQHADGQAHYNEIKAYRAAQAVRDKELAYYQQKLKAIRGLQHEIQDLGLSKLFRKQGCA